MVYLCTPCLYIFLAHHTCIVVGCGVGDAAVVVAVGTGNSDTAYTAGLEAFVTIVVP